VKLTPNLFNRAPWRRLAWSGDGDAGISAVLWTRGRSFNVVVVRGRTMRRLGAAGYSGFGSGAPPVDGCCRTFFRFPLLHSSCQPSAVPSPGLPFTYHHSLDIIRAIAAAFSLYLFACVRNAYRLWMTTLHVVRAFDVYSPLNIVRVPRCQQHRCAVACPASIILCLLPLPVSASLRWATPGRPSIPAFFTFCSLNSLRLRGCGRVMLLPSIPAMVYALLCLSRYSSRVLLPAGSDIPQGVGWFAAFRMRKTIGRQACAWADFEHRVDRAGLCVAGVVFVPLPLLPINGCDGGWIARWARDW